MTEAPLVTAIITTCERPRLIGRAIDSVFAQTYPAIECVVVNDGADDATREVLAAKQREYPALRVLQDSPRSGASAARNAGIAAARGAFLGLLDDDDVWLPTKIAKQVARMEAAGPDCALVYTWFEERRGDAVVLARHATLEGEDVFRHMIASQPIGNTSTLLVRKAAAEAIGGFDVKIARGLDGDFIRRLAYRYSVAVVPEVLTWLYVGHEYERITTDSETGLRRALKAHKAKLDKFPALARDFPAETARLHAVIALHHARLREIGGTGKHMFRALGMRPFSPKIWRIGASVTRALMVARVARSSER